jgi:hypothetical protein
VTAPPIKVCAVTFTLSLSAAAGALQARIGPLKIGHPHRSGSCLRRKDLVPDLGANGDYWAQLTAVDRLGRSGLLVVGHRAISSAGTEVPGRVCTVVPASGSRSSLLTPRLKCELGPGGKRIGVASAGWLALPLSFRVLAEHRRNWVSQER